jgi:hypothetical protein
MYESDYENGVMSEPDAVLTKALVAIGLLSVHGEGDGYREDAIDALRELSMLMEDGGAPFIGVARLSLDMVDNYADDLSHEAAIEYFEKAQDFAHVFMAGIPDMGPQLRLVTDEGDDEG